MSRSITYTDEIQMVTVTCCQCSCVFAVTATFNRVRREDGKTFWCPAGHPQDYTDSEIDKLRRDRDRLKQDAARLEDERRHQQERADAADRSTVALRDAATKLKRRIAAGSCPCCNRNFENMARHIKTKHPEFREAPVDNVVLIGAGKAS